MRIYKATDYNDMSRKAANIISAQIIMKPDCVLGLATGSSPVGTYKQLIEWYNKNDLDFSEVTSINLDEYKGLSPEDPQSYRYFMNTHLFDHVNIDKNRTFVPDGLATDPEKACAEYNANIIKQGGIDLQLLGIGPNGHIGFNEPADHFEAGTHCVDLTDPPINKKKTLIIRRNGVAGGVFAGGGAGVACHSGIANGNVIAVRGIDSGLLPAYIGKSQGAAIFVHRLGNKGHIGVGEVWIGALRRHRAAAGPIARGLHLNGSMVKGQDALIAVLGLGLQLRLQHFQNFRHIFGLALQRDNLDKLPRVRFCLVVFQQIKERIGVALTLKVSGGDRGRIVLRGQVVDLFQTVDAVFLAGPDLGGIGGNAG